MWRADSLEKTLMLGKIKGKRRRRWQRMRWLDSNTNSVDMNLSQLQEIVEDRGAWHVTVHGVVKAQTQLSDWKTTLLKQCWLLPSIYLFLQFLQTAYYSWEMTFIFLPSIIFFLKFSLIRLYAIFQVALLPPPPPTLFPLVWLLLFQDCTLLDECLFLCDAFLWYSQSELAIAPTVVSWSILLLNPFWILPRFLVTCLLAYLTH